MSNGYRGISEVDDPGTLGVWATYYGDMSSVMVWAGEIDALRDAVQGSKTCRFIKWGEEIR